ncbi:hypothetical protein K431DRAFT_281083 [Polychaeton citri CBS 116435]|uniref:Uncharacterized protein n=1 Tax=Polychaeton citri CBS 116435 TaxID=1314669 RepID=A0A9P4UUG3_9PEZI|nr:hypothetical protein K431DRAFT_281083 [Polychaeton citri CBS 116435]
MWVFLVSHRSLTGDPSVGESGRKIGPGRSALELQRVGSLGRLQPYSRFGGGRRWAQRLNKASLTAKSCAGGWAPVMVYTVVASLRMLGNSVCLGAACLPDLTYLDNLGLKRVAHGPHTQDSRFGISD